LIRVIAPHDLAPILSVHLDASGASNSDNAKGQTDMKDLEVSLIEIRIQLERERQAIELSIQDVDRVIALVQARNVKAPNQAEPNEKSSSERKPEEEKIETADHRYKEMAIEAVREAGLEGMAPQKLRDELGINQQRFKALVTTLVASNRICRIGERGRGVKYVIPRSHTSIGLNGADHAHANGLTR
jgi:hypothetical protein